MEIKKTDRVQAIYDQLDKACQEYVDAKLIFERARVNFEAARERFGGIKKLAASMLTFRDLDAWYENHKDVAYAGMSIGDAILDMLRDRAWQAAGDYTEGKAKKFSPWITLDGIVECLEGGGFEFKTATPLREVNGAVMRLTGITKVGRAYQISETDETFGYVKQYIEDRKKEAK